VRTLGAFIFEDILCRYGAVEEIITNNGPPYVKVLEYLQEKYRIHNIRISPYNSRANGVIERAHRDFREALIKSVDGDESRWLSGFSATLWAERVTIKRSIKMSPFYVAHGIEPLFPFDLAEATYLVPPLGEPLSTSDLIAIRSRQLQKREEDLAQIGARVWEARQQSVADFIKANESKIVDYDFKEGDLVLVRNSSVEHTLSSKTKPRYGGPMVVVRRTRRGSYILAELDGAVSSNRYAAFRLVPYFPRSHIALPVTHLTERVEEEVEEDDQEEMEDGGGGDEIEINDEDETTPAHNEPAEESRPKRVRIPNKRYIQD
jgi:hypothetical protein